jgi:hypothetical protein
MMRRGLAMLTIAFAAFAGGWFSLPWISGQLAMPSAMVSQVVSPPPDPEPDYLAGIQPILDRHCFDCHSDGIRKGGVEFDTHRDLETLFADLDLWAKVRDQIDFHLMPPPDEPQPTPEERKALVSWIDDRVFWVDPANPDPGVVTMRRLNRTEYHNTIRDLLGVEIDVSSLLPPDDTGYGFDNIGDVLTVSASHVERYHTAASTALDEALVPGKMPPPRVEMRQRHLQGPDSDEGGVFLSTQGEAWAEFRISQPGSYRIEVIAGSEKGGDEEARMELRVGGDAVHMWQVTAAMDSPAPHVHEFTLTASRQTRVAAAFVNDFWDPDGPPGRRDRNLHIHEIRVIGPLDGPPLPKPASHTRLIPPRPPGQDLRAWAAGILENFALRAFRRPPEDGEIERYLGLVDAAMERGEDSELGLRDAFEVMLVSPWFLFRGEIPGDDPTSDQGGKVLVDEFALASRLSYFLWSSMPDDRLLELAGRGKLRASLDDEITRMLASPKADALVSDFAGQWLQLRDVLLLAPDVKRFPDFDTALAADMRRETEELIKLVLRENLPVHTLISADFTFVNERLARHYGIPDVHGDEFRRVPLGSERRGILGHASILTLTSYPTRTSPVLRGKYILETILDTPPPPPPQNIPPLESATADAGAASLRAELERHRADPNCSACHALIDPLGFGLESFDAIGRFRDSENSQPIDTSGELLDGTAFTGPAELLEILATQYEDRFLHSITTRMLTYALGRGLTPLDRPAIDEIKTQARENETRIIPLIRAVIHSVPFQYRRTP